jgi:hypothetical protein
MGMVFKVLRPHTLNALPQRLGVGWPLTGQLNADDAPRFVNFEPTLTVLLILQLSVSFCLLCEVILSI